jgi:gas vesicle protein
MSKKLIGLLLGFSIGAALGAVLVMLFAPVTGKPLRAQVSGHYQQALESAREAGEKRREELEAELEQMRGPKTA